MLASARKHGVQGDDMLHACRHPFCVFEVCDLVMPVGGDRTGRLLEIGLAEAEGIEFIVHAMPARSKFVR